MPDSIGRKFMLETQLKNLSTSDQMKGIEQPPLTKGMGRAEHTVYLPDPENLETNKVDLLKAIEGRKSVRKYSDDPLTLNELTFLLWSTQGLIREMGKATLRTVPSAGARHALETYLLVNGVDPLAPGLFRYQPIEHLLIQEKKDESLASQITAACLGQKMVSESAVTFIWTAVPYRMNWRYGERGYRYLHLDAGHVCQNLYLAAEAVDCGVCAIGAYDDDEVNKLVGVDGIEEFVIYMATVGKKVK